VTDGRFEERCSDLSGEELSRRGKVQIRFGSRCVLLPVHGKTEVSIGDICSGARARTAGVEGWVAGMVPTPKHVFRRGRATIRDEVTGFAFGPRIERLWNATKRGSKNTIFRLLTRKNGTPRFLGQVLACSSWTQGQAPAAGPSDCAGGPPNRGPSRRGKSYTLFFARLVAWPPKTRTQNEQSDRHQGSGQGLPARLHAQHPRTHRESAPRGETPAVGAGPKSVKKTMHRALDSALTAWRRGSDPAGRSTDATASYQRGRTPANCRRWGRPPFPAKDANAKARARRQSLPEGRCLKLRSRAVPARRDR